MIWGEGSAIRKRALWRSDLAVRGYRLLRRAADRAGLQVVLKTFYSPIPDVWQLPDAAWQRASPMRGVDWDLEAQLRFLEENLAPHIPDFRWTQEPTGDRDAYYVNNDTFGIVDSTTLFAMIRHLRPRRILEMGSGFTTLTLAQAARANAADGHPVDLRVFDPYPGVVRDELPGLTALVRTRAQDVPLSTFEALEPGDVLFVDTTHTVKMGSEVNYLILDVLPALRQGVVVHFHDIYLPWEYRRELLEDYGLYWSEQYLLQAFLACNSEFEILCAIHAVAQTFNERLRQLIPMQPGGSGAGFWIRRVTAP
jgi:hypothetical protein